MIRPSRIHSLFFLLTAVIWASCGNQKSEKQTPPSAINVTVQTVQKSNSLAGLTYTATIEPDNTAKIGFAVAGVVDKVMVKEGQMVSQGQLLASIDATEYRNALAIANANLEQAKDSYSRLNDLYQKGSLPAKDFVDIKTKLIQAKANKSINTKYISDSKLYAPMAGIVTERSIEPGSTVAPGVVAFTLIKTAKVYAKITVPESEVGKLSQHMKASVFIPTLDDSMSGTIAIINPQADLTSKSYTVKIQLDNAHRKLLPGMMANVKIDVKNTKELILIPSTAVMRDADGLTYVYIASTDNKAIRKRITVGSLTGQQEVIVENGLSPGDRLVVEGLTNLRDGASIRF